MKHNTHLKYVLLAGASAMIATCAQAQTSEEAEDATARLKTVTVTAQRTEESLQSVPIAITAVTGEMLNEAGIADVSDLALQTPGVVMKTDFGTVNPNIFIRGIGISDFNANVTGAVGVYIDDVYTASPAAQLFQFFDADRVEILRGPQGTLYGRNTTGGAFNFVSRKPTDELSADLYAEYGNYNAVKVDGGIGGPIVAGKLNGRISGTLAQREALLDNAYTGPQPIADELNDINRWGARGQLEFIATENLDFLLTTYGGSSDTTALQNQQRGLLDPVTFGPCSPSPRQIGQCVDVLGYADTDGDNFKGEYNGPSIETVDFWGTTLKGNLRFSGFDLTSVTAYQDVDRYTHFDGDQSPNDFLIPLHIANSDQFSQELRLTSPQEDRFRWLLGGFYFDETLDFDGEFDLFGSARPAIVAAAAGLTPDQLALSPGGFVNGYNPLGGPDLAATLGNAIFAYPAQVLKYDYQQQVETWAVFGQAYYDISPDITFTLGLRYSEEDRTFDYNSSSVEAPSIVIPFVETSDALGNNTTSFNDLSFRTALEWQATDDLFLFASVSEASKSGGFNGAILFYPDQAVPFDDETLRSYEAGFKSELFDKRLRFNSTAFFYEYNDLQVFVLASTGGIPQQVLTNAASAEVYGLEIEALAQPIEPLLLSFGMSYLESEFTDFEVPSNFGVALQDYTGNNLPYSPELSWSSSATYTHDLSNGGSLVFGLDATYSDEAFVDAANTPRVATDDYLLFGARLAYRLPGDNVEVGIWGRNITDEEYIAQNVDLSDFGIDYVTFGDPATYGISLRLTY